MNFIVVGMSHHQTPEAIRQKYAFSPAQIQNFLNTLNPKEHSLIILSTCNRLEIYSESLTTAQAKLLWGELLQYCNCTYYHPTYILFGRKCIEHAFKVALGLDSRVLREHQVLGQMRKAFRNSQERYLLSQGIRKLFERCFQMSKNIRTYWKKASLGLLAVKYLALIAKGRPIFILGAGEIVKDFLSHCDPLKDSPLMLCNRTHENAVLAAKHTSLPIQIIPFDECLTKIALSPIIVLGISTAEPFLDTSCFPLYTHHYDIIDFGIPSSLSPTVKNQNNITLKSLDSFHNATLDSEEEMNLLMQIQQQIATFEQDVFLHKKRHLVVNYRKKLEKECERLTTQALLSYERGGDPSSIMKKLAYKMQQKLLHQPSIAFKQSMLESHHLDFFYHSADAISLSPIKSFESV